MKKIDIKNLSISTKIVAPLVFGVVFGLLLLVSISYYGMQKVENKVFSNISADMTAVIGDQVAAAKSVALASISFMSESEQLAGAMIAQSRPAAEGYVASMVAKLQDATGLQDIRIHVHDGEMKSLVRSWDTARFGDDLSQRPLIRAVHETKKIVSGFESGSSGLMFRAVGPIFGDEGEVIGSVEIALPLSTVFYGLLEHDYQAIAVLMDSSVSLDKGAKSVGSLSAVTAGTAVLTEDISAYDTVSKEPFQVADNAMMTPVPVAGGIGGKDAYIIGFTAKSYVQDMVSDAERLSVLQTLMMIGSSVSVLAFIWFVSRLMVTNPMRRMISLTKDLAQGDGDLTKRLNIKVMDEVGQAGMYVDQFVEKVREAISEATSTATETALSGEELSATSMNLAHNINEQMSLVEQSDALIKDVGENLDLTEEMAITTTEDLEKTLQVLSKFVDKLTDVVHCIHEESEKQKQLSDRMQDVTNQVSEITAVLGIISDIADQTNLLALNASIEAARAGEHGRGFAVVADEVRKLAEKTQASLDGINRTARGIVSSIDNVHEQIQKTSEDILAVSVDAGALIGLAEDSKEKLCETVTISSDVVKKSTYIATKTKSLIEVMNRIVVLSTENRNSGEGVEQIAQTLAAKSSRLQTLLTRFRT